jgi:hypothetical protein
MKKNRVSFNDKSNKLVLNTVYESKDPWTNLSCEPLTKIFALNQSINNKKKNLFGNSGGIRTSVDEDKNILAILIYSDERQNEWPDTIQENILTYYGDSRKSNAAVGINTKGNNAFYDTFTRKHDGQRLKIPPIFVFFKEHLKPGLNIEFKGLAIPGFMPKKEKKEELILDPNADIDAPNFIGKFTILDEVKDIDRLWFSDIAMNRGLKSKYCPKPWKTWLNKDI